MQLQCGVLIVAEKAGARAKIRTALVDAGYFVAGEVHGPTAAVALAEIEYLSAAVVDGSCCSLAQADEIVRSLAAEADIPVVMVTPDMTERAIASAVRSVIGKPWVGAEIPGVVS